MNVRERVSQVFGTEGGRSFLWLVLDRGIRLALSVSVGLLVARYLGPEQFGVLNHALAVVALAGPLAELGLDAVARREFVLHPERSAVTAGTVFRLRAVGAGVSLCGVFVWSRLSAGSAEELRLFAILALATLQPAGMVADTWLQSRLEMRHSVVPQWGVLLVGAAARLVAIHERAPVEAFAAISVVELGLITFVVLRAARTKGFRFGCFDKALAIALLRQAWPLLLSGFAVLLYMRTDVLMLRFMDGERAVGLYSAATRLSEIWFFLPGSLAAALLPGLLAARSAGELPYRAALRRYYDLNAAAAYLVSIPTVLCAAWLVRLAYGPDFAAAGPVLAWHASSLVFTFLGVARGQFLVNEGYTRFYLVSTVTGLVTNIGFNLVLIPRMGASGAALGTLAAQMTAAWLSTFCYAPVRANALLQTRALLIPFTWFRYLH